MKPDAPVRISCTAERGPGEDKMEQFNISFWVQMVVYAVSFGVFYGKITTQISNLEKTVERHNNVVGKVAVIERDVDAALRLIDDMKKGANT